MPQAAPPVRIDSIRLENFRKFRQISVDLEIGSRGSGRAAQYTIRPRVGLAPRDTHRARETIRVSALDHLALSAMRRAWMSGLLDELRSIADALDPESAAQYRALVAADYEESAFSSAILDLLGVAP